MQPHCVDTSRAASLLATNTSLTLLGANHRAIVFSLQRSMGVQRGESVSLQRDVVRYVQAGLLSANRELEDENRRSYGRFSSSTHTRCLL
jgi:hypothetical protein